jgi:hypothetical protein
VIVTLVPPAAGPEDGLTPETEGGAVLYVNRSAALVALVPLAVVTVTSTVPDPDGEFAVICVALMTVTLVAALPPKLTVLPPTAKFAPVTVTCVPPPVGPDDGLTPVTVGGAGPPIVYWLELTTAVSEVVEADTVLVDEAVEGFVTPLSATLTVSVGLIASPLNMPQVTVVVADEPQLPTVVPVFVSITEEPVSKLR